MTKQIILLSLVVATILVTSILSISISQANAFDPGGPPVGGAVPTVPTGNWEMINYGPTGGGYSPQNQINKDNVQYLETKWVFPYTQTPIPSTLAPAQIGSGAPVVIVDGVGYVLMNDRRILSIDLTTGKLIWNNTYGTAFDAKKETEKYPWLQQARAHGHAINYYREKGWLITSSIGSCNLYAVDAKTGKTAWTLTTEQVCGTNEEFGDPTKGIIGTLGNQGYMSSLGTHPPQFLGNIMFYPVGGASGAGGRSFVTAFDMSDPQNPKRLYRTFVMPPAQGDPNWAIDQCKAASGNGWYFEYPRFLEGINYPARDREPTYLATQCTAVPDDVVRNDWIDLAPGSKTFGKVHTASAISPVWGHYQIDPETGIVYLGFGDQGPYTNLTHRYGPGLHGSGYAAFDVRTGKLVWFFSAVPHDLWDYDCSWGGILGQVQGKKAYIKGCKSGHVFAFDAATGKPFWVYDPPTIDRNFNYGVDSQNNSPRGPNACCRMTKEDLAKPWPFYPSKEPFLVSCPLVCLESDIAYDGKRVYVGTFNLYSNRQETNVLPFGNNGRGLPLPAGFDSASKVNSNVDAVDANTGKRVWSYRLNSVTYRGGLMVTGGMVVAYANDGNLKFLDAETGKLINRGSLDLTLQAASPTPGSILASGMPRFAARCQSR